MNKIFNLIENGSIKLNDGCHKINDINVMFINGKPYSGIVVSNVDGSVLFETNQLNIYTYEYINLSRCMKLHLDSNKCKYTIKVNLKGIDLFYTVYLKFIPFKSISEKNKDKGEELFSKLKQVISSNIMKEIYNIDDNIDDDDEF